MRRFRAFYEKGLPKSTDLEDVAGDNYSDATGLPTLSNKDDTFWSKYINDLSSWLDGDGGRFILKHKDRVPAKYRKGGTLYRGLAFYDYGYRDLLKILKSGKLMPEKHTKMSSWTSSIEAATGFSEQNQVGIVVVAKIATKDVVLNVEKWALDPAIVKLGAAATDDWFQGMGFVYRESEIIVAHSRGAIPVNSKTVKRIFVGDEMIDNSIDALIKWLQNEIDSGRGTNY